MIFNWLYRKNNKVLIVSTQIGTYYNIIFTVNLIASF